ncbi:hypothetical protein ARMGADRAFT_1041066 [Armillaria gallica]|uniref:Enterotoxin n=1 Tax=Armillaria gallica TaxID=47427 RepID=A0A2H3CSH5_ARMGA|nr:hypothetical protein ARMGADRAFT_1041067 [Armillaria gallica]PBK79065.1 hypothetical protein ARMGADRAFT_1041066 [Armillaria gallica]
MKNFLVQLAAVLLLLALKTLASSDEPNPGNNGINLFWGQNPFWNNGGNGNVPPPTTSQLLFPFPYGTYGPNMGMPAQNNMRWTHPYGFQPFTPQFMQGHLFFGAYPPPGSAHDGPQASMVDSTLHSQSTAHEGEGELMTVDFDPDLANTGSTPDERPAADTMGTTVDTAPRRRWGNSASEGKNKADEMSENKKGKKKASWREVEADSRQEHHKRGHTSQVGDPVAALRSQLTLNLDLMKKYNELEKLVSKRQHLPHRQPEGTVKQHREERKKPYDTRWRISNELDKFLKDGEDKYYRPRSWPSWGWGQGAHPIAGGRQRETNTNRRDTCDYRDNTSHQPRTIADLATPIPRHRTPITPMDKHDAHPDSYDQRRFGHIVGDTWMDIDERIEELSSGLPPMPRPDSTYPPRFISLQEMEEDLMSKALDNVHDDKLPYTPEQKAKCFKEWVKFHQKHTGRLPTWLGRFCIPGLNSVERNNSFWGMYRPGFTYDHHQNIVYTDNKAVEAARALSNRQEFPIPHRMGFWEVRESIHYIHNKAPHWQSVLGLLVEFHRITTSIIVRYRDLSMHDVIKQFHSDRRLTEVGNNLPAPPFVPIDLRYRCSGGGSSMSGAGLPPPGDATLDDWCQYAAHHFRPGGVNSPNGITMDLSPYHTGNYYGQYLAGIAFRPQYYTDYIEQWNRERTEEPPIAMIDSAYPWSMVWIDQHTSVHFCDHFRHLEILCQERLEEFGEPEVIWELQGWWTPDIGDTHCIWVLAYQDLYGPQTDNHGRVQENPSWLLHGKSTRFQYINTYPPTSPSP